MTGGGDQGGEPGQNITKGDDTGGDLARGSSKATCCDRAPDSSKAKGGDESLVPPKVTVGDESLVPPKVTVGDESLVSDSRLSPKCTVGDDSRPSPKFTVGDESLVSSKCTVDDGSRPSPKCTVGDDSRPSPKCTVDDDSRLSPKCTVDDDSRPSPKVTIGDGSRLSPKCAVDDDSRPSPKVTIGDGSRLSPKCAVHDDSPNGTADYLTLASPKFTLKGTTSDSLQGTIDGSILPDEEWSDAQYLALSLMNDIDESIHTMEILKRAMFTSECDEESMTLKPSKVEEASITANHLEVVSPRSKRILEDGDEPLQILKRSKYDTPIVAQSPCESSGLMVALRSIMKRGKELHLERRDVRLEKRELRLENREAWLENREDRLEKRERLLGLYESENDRSLEQRKAEFDKNWEGYRNWLLYNTPLEDTPSPSIQDGPSPGAEDSTARAPQKASSPDPKTLSPASAHAPQQVAAPAPGTSTPGPFNRIADAVKTGVTTAAENLERADKMATLVEKVIAAPTRVQDLRNSYEDNKKIVSTLKESCENSEVVSSFKKVIAAVVTSSLLVARNALKKIARGEGDDDVE